MNDIASPQETWTHDIEATIPLAADWLWHGFLAKNNITLLTSLWKAGKTTLLSLLLSRRALGGTLAGLPVTPGKTIVITEEPMTLWAERSRRLNFGNNVCFLSQPFRTVPTLQQWQSLLDRVRTLHDQHTFDLAVVDPLAPFCPAENHARGMMDFLYPLTALARQGLAVFLLHHPGKGDKPLGQAARGSGALLAHVDISIEMRHPGGDFLTRRRRFIAFSRHPETPRSSPSNSTPRPPTISPSPPPKTTISRPAGMSSKWSSKTPATK